MISAIGGFIMFPQMERVTNIKQLQLMCGIRSVFYWMVCFIFDYIMYLGVVFLISLCIFAYGLVGSDMFSGPAEIGNNCNAMKKPNLNDFRCRRNNFASCDVWI